VPVVEQLDVGQAERVRASDPQLEHEPVGQVHKILVEHRDTAEDGRLAVVHAVGVGPGVVNAVGVLPLGGGARAEVAVAGRGQDFAQALLVGIKALVGERESLYRKSSNRWGGMASLAAARSAVKPARWPELRGAHRSSAHI